MANLLKQGLPFLYDDGTGEFVGILDSNGREQLVLSASERSSLLALFTAPSDSLVAPLQHVNITGAMSTTAAQSATATGTFYRARIAWNNNGASASAKLNIAVNSTNDVHGLLIGQSAKRRDHQMTMGDAVILVCSVPITRLTFSSDVSITANAHQLQVTFGG